MTEKLDSKHRLWRPSSLPGALAGLGASSTPCLRALPDATTVRVRVDVGVAVLREAWDFNRSTETLIGIVAGADHVVWRGVAIRGEGLVMRVRQAGDDASLGGFTVGTRMRWRRGQTRPFVDVAVGLSHATRPVPPTGTRFNYLAVIGAGIQRPVGPLFVAVTGRWVHASNTGREGRHLNPDVQSLGALVSVGWEQ